MLLLLGILSASCVFDAGQCEVSPDEPRSIRFRVSLEGQKTRAPWSDPYESEDGVPFDYRIQPENLRVIVLAADGTRLGNIQDLYYWPINESHTEFQFVGQMPDAFVEHFNVNGAAQPDYKFMVLANCGDNLSGEEYITYSYTQLDPSKEDSSIPMWGVAQADMTPLFSSANMDIGVIWLLRAAAKIEVKLSDKEKAKGTRINSAVLKYYNQTGYCLPSGAMQISETRSLDQENCIRVYRHAAVNMPFVQDPETGSYYIYVTEYDNVNYISERNKISIEFNVGGETKYFEDAVSFCQYKDGRPQDGSDYSIVRNHIYEFEILSIVGSNLILEYTVADWESEDWGDGMDYEEHELTYPTYHNPVVPSEYLTLSVQQQASYNITRNPEMYYSAGHVEEGAFECFFQIVAPADVQWKPVFMGTKENYKIRVYRYMKDQDSNAVQTLVFDTGDNAMQGNIGTSSANEWFRILVFPLSNDGAGDNTIDFGISYYQKWTDQYINLYVNGEYGNIRWPQSGDNPKIISIKHIEDPSSVQSEGE